MWVKSSATKCRPGTRLTNLDHCRSVHIEHENPSDGGRWLVRADTGIIAEVAGSGEAEAILELIANELTCGRHVLDLSEPNPARFGGSDASDHLIASPPPATTDEF